MTGLRQQLRDLKIAIDIVVVAFVVVILDDLLKIWLSMEDDVERAKVACWRARLWLRYLRER